MNVNKALWILCGTAVTICLLFILKPLIPSAPERVTSTERVLTQPERTTSTERVADNQLKAAERVISNQLTTAEIIRSNELAFQSEQMQLALLQRSNYNVAKAELASAWIKKLDELKAARKTDQNSLTLAHNELKAFISAKYNVSLDSEPSLPTPVVSTPIIIREPQVSSVYTPARSSQDAFNARYGIRRKASPQLPANASANSSQVAAMKAQAMTMARKMWAIEAAGNCYQHLDGHTKRLNPTTRNWEIVPDSQYDPTYDSIRLPLDKLRIEIQKYDPSFN